MCPSTTGNWGGWVQVYHCLSKGCQVLLPSSTFAPSWMSTHLVRIHLQLPSLSLGNYLPALQTGIVLLAHPARAPSRKSTASALPFFPKHKLWKQEGGDGRQGYPQAVLLLSSPPCVPLPLQTSRQPRRAGSWKKGWRGRRPGRPQIPACQQNGPGSLLDHCCPRPPEPREGPLLLCLPQSHGGLRAL